MKIVAGFFSFTEVTIPSEHRNYNEWHMLDHLPEQLTLTGIGWGQRWVSTPECRRARVVCAPAFEQVHYLTLYLLAPPLEHTLTEFRQLARELSIQGRFHRHRRTALTGAFDLVHTRASARVLVSDHAVPYRPNLGIHLRLDEVVDHQMATEHDRWLADEHLPALVALPGVAGAWTFRRLPDPQQPADRPDEQRITVAWLDAPPLDAIATITRLPDPPPGTVRTLFDGPFATIQPHEWNWFDAAESTGGDA